MRSRQREENIRQIKEKLTEEFADNEEWLAVLDEAVYQYQKKTVRKMILKDHKRPDGRADRPDPSAGSRSRFDSKSTWLCHVYPWTDTDLQRLHTGSTVRSTEDWMVWTWLTTSPNVICIIITSQATP